jgi:hypothetical protein
MSNYNISKRILKLTILRQRDSERQLKSQFVIFGG